MSYVLLLFSKATLPGFWFSEMIFGHPLSLRGAITVHARNHCHPLHAHADGGIDRFPHEHRVQLEMLVRDADRIDNSFSAFEGTLETARVANIGCGDFGFTRKQTL